MKKQQTPHGALRARTRAILCVLTILVSTTARADYTVTTQVLPAEAVAAGCSITGGGTYADNAQASFSASPASGWIFAQWRPSNKIQGYNDARNPIPGSAYNEDFTMTAFFVPVGTPTYTITQSVNNSSWGRVSSATINIDGIGTAIYEGSIVCLYTDNLGKGQTYFVRWSNGYTAYTTKGTKTQLSQQLVTVTGDAEYIAYWSDTPVPITPTYDVACTVSPAGAGTVTGDGTFEEGDDVTLTANPANRRYVFSHWTDEGSSAGTDGVATYSINSIAADHNNVVAVFTEVPVTLADNEETAYYTATASTFTGSMDFRMMRTFYAGMWNTVCFPFDLTADQITASDMSGATFYTLSSVTGDAAEGLDFNVSEVTSLSARTPYLVQVSGANIVNPVFAGVTLAASAFTNNTSGTDVGETHFFGTVHPTSLVVGENSGFLFLGQNNQLYWPNVANDIRAFRAYFYSGNNTVQAVHPRVRLVVRPETPTDVIEGYNADTWSAVGLPVPTRKVLDNGNLIIERGGIRYNAVGQVIR